MPAEGQENNGVEEYLYLKSITFNKSFSESWGHIAYIWQKYLGLTSLLLRCR
jgi:hypothetical protein